MRVRRKVISGSSKGVGLAGGGIFAFFGWGQVEEMVVGV